VVTTVSTGYVVILEDVVGTEDDEDVGKEEDDVVGKEDDDDVGKEEDDVVGKEDDDDVWSTLIIFVLVSGMSYSYSQNSPIKPRGHKHLGFSTIVPFPQ